MNPQLINNILVPVDLSEASLNALDIAVQITKKNKAILHLLVIDEPSYIKEKQTDTLYDDKSRTSTISNLLFSINNKYDIIPNVILKKGHVTETILSTAKAEKADLIIMGTHGESGFREHFTGSNAYNVIKYTAVPVLSIPPKQKIYDFTKALLPIRATSDISLKCNFISSLLSEISTLEVLDLVNNNESAQPDKLERIASEIRNATNSERLDVNVNLNLNTTWDVTSTLSRDIFRFAQLREADLIIVTTGLDGETRKGFIGAQVQKIISSSQLPVLTLKTEKVAEEVCI